ncbi:MAG: hypothetical protein M3R25_11805 [Bacteroidota bacterium]|nr:hypothetical protein [Bacteroidota bacterium]
MTRFYKSLSALSLLFAFHWYVPATSQTNIDWQKSIGTPSDDSANKLFNDLDGNLLIIGSEYHADFAGNVKNYMLITKLDVEGNEVYKKYHDVSFETFSLPFDYYFGRHYYTTESARN